MPGSNADIPARGDRDRRGTNRRGVPGPSRGHDGNGALDDREDPMLTAQDYLVGLAIAGTLVLFVIAVASV
jgi:hypothetical protein